MWNLSYSILCSQMQFTWQLLRGFSGHVTKTMQTADSSTFIPTWQYTRTLSRRKTQKQWYTQWTFVFTEFQLACKQTTTKCVYKSSWKTKLNKCALCRIHSKIFTYDSYHFDVVLNHAQFSAIILLNLLKHFRTWLFEYGYTWRFFTFL